MESDDHDQGANQTNQRSYECNFCKRGFSNAQALGGHMNIHRKDKAKLKQQFLNPSLEGNKSSEEPNKPNLNLNVSQQEPARDEIQMKQLPLFAESPIITTSEAPKPQGQMSQIHGVEEGGRGSSLELDLELRLWPEPQDSSAATGIRKFF